ncbi:MAG TPA: type II toxin-antitoxin system ParD family antitoxin [Pirellulaceae bacterium]|nr:type II toxin-antitoxin system ParD family antitoxin [Pirellulaceae bacterium]
MIQMPDEIQTLIDEQLVTGRYADAEDVLRHALIALRNEHELYDEEATLAGIKQGLADSAAGRYKSLSDYDRDFRARHGLSNDA